MKAHWWGLEPPENVTIAWSARAIYHSEKYKPTPRHLIGRKRKLKKSPAHFELLTDRQSTKGRVDELLRWINKTGLPRLRKEIREAKLSSDCNVPLGFTADGYTVESSPRGSCGYLYIVIYPTPENAKVSQGEAW